MRAVKIVRTRFFFPKEAREKKKIQRGSVRLCSEMVLQAI